MSAHEDRPDQDHVGAFNFEFLRLVSSQSVGAAEIGEGINTNPLALDQARCAMGVEHAHDFFDAWAPYTLWGTEDRHTTPLLRLAGEDEIVQTSPSMITDTFRYLAAVRAPAEIGYFPRETGAASHCQMGGLASTSASPSPGSAPPPETAPPAPPASATAWNNDQMPGLPELDIARVRRWCEQRVPPHARDQVRVECDAAPRHLTIVECRPPWRQGTGPEWTRFPIARLRYTQATKMWTLYWRDRNLRFHRYDQLEPSPDIGNLLHEIDRDPIAIFWG